MNTDGAQQPGDAADTARACGLCTRPAAEFARAVGGQSICHRCYKAHFTPVSCIACHRSYRVLPGRSESWLCQFCARSQATLVCVRCKRIPHRIARRFSDGSIACGTCAVYYRESAICSRCGGASQKISAIPKLAIDQKLCEVCRRKETQGTCEVCGRNRELTGITPAGNKSCNQCLAGVAPLHPCPVCGGMCVGHVGTCRPCVQAKRLRQLAVNFGTELRSDWSRNILARYVEWFIMQYAKRREAYAMFRHHCSFFRTCDAEFSSDLEFESERMLLLFDVAGLKKYEIPVRFLHEQYGLVIDAYAKLRHAKRRHIRILMERAQVHPWWDLFQRFHAYLAHRKSVDIHLLDMALIAVEKFFITENVQGIDGCTPLAVRRFLAAHPGYLRAFSVFLKFCREDLQIAIPLPVGARRAAEAKRSRSKRVVDKLIDAIVRRGVEQTPLAILQRALAISFHFSYEELDQGTWMLIEQNGAHVLVHGGEEIRLIPALVPVAEQWLHLRRNPLVRSH